MTRQTHIQHDNSWTSLFLRLCFVALVLVVAIVQAFVLSERLVNAKKFWWVGNGEYSDFGNAMYIVGPVLAVLTGIAGVVLFKRQAYLAAFVPLIACPAAYVIGVLLVPTLYSNPMLIHESFEGIPVVDTIGEFVGLGFFVGVIPGLLSMLGLFLLRMSDDYEKTLMTDQLPSHRS